MSSWESLFQTRRIESRETYNFLIVAALMEELNEFYNLNEQFSTQEAKEGGAFEVSCTIANSNVKILTYTPNLMGMPYSAAAIMRIIEVHQPVFTLMIGTCARIKGSHDLGDVLIPNKVFSYESGKYENGLFIPDYESYSLGENLRKQAERLKAIINKSLSYKVATDIDFCSGAAVVDDSELSEKIIERCSRKLAGLDMEAYSLACINNIVRAAQKEVLVVKGISDFAKNKGVAEQQGNKELAKRNSADFAYRLIQHLQETLFGPSQMATISSNPAKPIGYKVSKQEDPSLPAQISIDPLVSDEHEHRFYSIQKIRVMEGEELTTHLNRFLCGGWSLSVRKKMEFQRHEVKIATVTNEILTHLIDSLPSHFRTEIRQVELNKKDLQLTFVLYDPLEKKVLSKETLTITDDATMSGMNDRGYSLNYQRLGLYKSVTS